MNNTFNFSKSNFKEKSYKKNEEALNLIEIIDSEDEENDNEIYIEEESEKEDNIGINFNTKNNSNLNHVNKKENKINVNMTFDESIENLKNKFRNLFNNKNNFPLNNDEFRKNISHNKNMELIFKFNDVIQEIYETKINTKIIEKDCDINRIIDIYMNKLFKLAKKRKIVIKNYKNLIFVVGAEIYINKIDKQSKEFIIKKRTETFKGNQKINTFEDGCYITEINNQKKEKQIFKELGDITVALIMLLQNLDKDAVLK